MNPEHVLRRMIALEGSEHEFVVQRAVDAQARDGLSAGISMEAMEGLQQNMTTWVGTRMLRFEKEHGIMPQTVRVVVSVEMEG